MKTHSLKVLGRISHRLKRQGSSNRWYLWQIMLCVCIHKRESLRIDALFTRICDGIPQKLASLFG